MERFLLRGQIRTSISYMAHAAEKHNNHVTDSTKKLQ